jgi:hypothetical protein
MSTHHTEGQQYYIGVYVKYIGIREWRMSYEILVRILEKKAE